MIYAKSFEIGNQVRLELSRPDERGVQVITLDNYAEAERYMYTANRNWMIEKVSGWLKMRHRALSFGNSKRLTEGSARLSVVIGYHKHASFAGVCRLIKDHSTALEEVAPAMVSQQYPYYERVIMPIIKYCRENG